MIAYFFLKVTTGGLSYNFSTFLSRKLETISRSLSQGRYPGRARASIDEMLAWSSALGDSLWSPESMLISTADGHFNEICWVSAFDYRAIATVWRHRSCHFLRMRNNDLCTNLTSNETTSLLSSTSRHKMKLLMLFCVLGSLYVASYSGPIHASCNLTW